jgi:NADPH-dependent glutamate synthase beta subunit-like oxidoreductase
MHQLRGVRQGLPHLLKRIRRRPESRKASGISNNTPRPFPGRLPSAKKGHGPLPGTCPAHVSVQGYIALINAGQVPEALELFKKDHPFPGVCGRVCHHPCESVCTRNEVDEPLAIQYLHRFLADGRWKIGRVLYPGKKGSPQKKSRHHRGRPGRPHLCLFLAIEGYQVTVFEKLPVLGGMLTVGIPAYRLPRNIIESEIQVIKDLGVEFKTGVEIGKDVTIAQLRETRATNPFSWASGPTSARFWACRAKIWTGVYPGVDFLREFNLGNRSPSGDRVAVIGGGNVAMDSVRTALRTGSKKPFVIYRRSEAEMPANEVEIEECREEGIDIMTLTTPVRIIGDETGQVKAIECIRMELGEPDDSGRRRPVPIEGSEFTMEVDTVIPAIGQESTGPASPTNAPAP